jgi:phosphonate transport system permease protein
MAEDIRTPQALPRVASAMPEPLGWLHRLDALSIVGLGFVLLIVISLPGIHGSGRDLDYAANLSRFAAQFWPPDPSILPDLGRALIETARIAVVATAIAVVVSLPLGVLLSQRFAPWPLVWAVRLLLNGIRTIPSLIWALLAVAVVGPYPLAGVIALVGYSVGYLGKFFGDSVDAADPATTASLRALGAGPLQAFRWGLWPQLRPQLASHALWMLEYNLRSAAIIGYVGAGGIGVQLHTFQEYGQWDRFGTVLLCILAMVTVLDTVGGWVRRKLTA